MSLFNDFESEDNNPDSADLGESKEQNETSDSGNEPSWWLDKERAGDGERPEWLPPKFKSVEDMAKSYAGLEKRLGEVPDQYDLSIATKYFDPDYESFDELTQYAKEKRVPQDVMDKMFDSVNKYLSEFDIDINEERKALGENAKERLVELNNWAKSNLDANEFGALTMSLRTADAIKALEKLRGISMSNETRINNDNQMENSEGLTLDAVQAEMAENLDKYKTNPAYRREIQRKIEQATQKNPLYADRQGYN